MAAVTTLATRERGLSRSAQLGLAWGVGHTVSVALVATALIVLGIRVPERFYHVAELGVATLLIVLGVGSLIAESRRHKRALGNEHGEAHAEAHAHHHPHVHPDTIRSSSRALGFGVAHGLAGSGAVVVLLVAASTQLREQISYLVAFGVGTIAGMSLVSMMTGVAANAAAQRHHRAGQWIRVGAACVSVVIGVMLGAEVVRGM